MQTSGFRWSLWRSLFLMYQGALTMCLSTLFWNLCIIFILLCLVQPQSWIPYVHTGFSICLYMMSLLWRDSEEFLPINPLNPELNPICYLLVLLGAHHFLHVSRTRVKLLTFRLLMSYIYMEHTFLMFLDHTQRRSTVGWTPLDE